MKELHRTKEALMLSSLLPEPQSGGFSKKFKQLSEIFAIAVITARRLQKENAFLKEELIRRAGEDKNAKIMAVKEAASKDLNNIIVTTLLLDIFEAENRELNGIRPVRCETSDWNYNPLAMDESLKQLTEMCLEDHVATCT